ncbi:MAG: hypothetical protein ACQEQV_01200 [Fibrobacterota bacterium]
MARLILWIILTSMILSARGAELPAGFSVLSGGSSAGGYSVFLPPVLGKPRSILFEVGEHVLYDYSLFRDKTLRQHALGMYLGGSGFRGAVALTQLEAFGLYTKTKLRGSLAWRRGVIGIFLGFTPSYERVPEHNRLFSGIRGGGAVFLRHSRILAEAAVKRMRAKGGPRTVSLSLRAATRFGTWGEQGAALFYRPRIQNLSFVLSEVFHLTSRVSLYGTVRSAPLHITAGISIDWAQNTVAAALTEHTDLGASRSFLWQKERKLSFTGSTGEDPPQ